MRQLHASNGVGLRGTEARSNVLQGVGLHNLDYVNLASVSELRAFYLRIPGRGGGRRAAPSRTSGLQARRGVAHFPGASIQQHQYASPAPAVVSWDKPTETTATATFPVSKEGGMQGREVPSRAPSSRFEGPDSADWKWLHVAPLSRAPCVFCAASLCGAHLFTFRLWEKQWKQSLPLFCNILIVNLL